MASKFKSKTQDPSVESVQVRKSEWLDTCQAMGCCLKPSVSIGGHQLCTYHATESQGEGYKNWQAISEAIRDNLSLIKKAYSLIYKQHEFWSKPETVNALRGWDFCPYLTNETPNLYISKLLNKVERVIKDSASDLILHGNIRGTHIKDKPKGKPKGVKSIVEIAESLDAMRNQ